MSLPDLQAMRMIYPDGNTSGTSVASGGPSLAPYLNTLNTDSGIFHSDPSLDPKQQQMLADFQKYDPNARFADTGYADNGDHQWDFIYDPSKIPGADGNHTLMDSSKINGNWDSGINQFSLPFQRTPTDASGMLNPNLHYNSSSWGDITSNQNIKNAKPEWWDTLGKYATMATLGSAFGMAGGSLFGGMGLGSIGSTLGKFGLNEIMSGGQSKFNPLSLASSFLPNIPGMDQIMPYVNTAQSIYGASKGNLGSIYNLARMGYNTIGGH